MWVSLSKAPFSKKSFRNGINVSESVTGKRQKAKGKRHAGYFVNERFLIKFVSGDAHMADIAELS